MAKQMLIDATHPDETRVVVVSGSRLEEFDYETSARRQLKGNIYLAKVTRVEPSLQAAFVDYGGNRHGFLPFSEIHPDYYKIPVADLQSLVAEEEALQSDVAEEEPEEEPGAGQGESKGSEEAAEARPGNGADAAAAQPETAGPDKANGAGGSAGGGELEEVEVETRVDTVGGDEVDENARRRAASPRRYKIQEVIKRRQVLLVQVAKEERGTKGAALTTYLSLAGRYCVLMPNTNKGGGISRKIGSVTDRRRLKQIVSDLSIPDGMAVIVRTAGSERSKIELRRDYQYLLRLWDEIRETTLKSNAPSLIYEEANLIKRAIRDLYSRDMERVLVAGDEGYKLGKSFMKSLMPSHARNVQLYKDEAAPLFQRYKVERQLDDMHDNSVELRSGGYIVINSTEALVAIDVNSGRATRERHIEETALKTNLEAAEEVARQLRLRDLAGLIVIDFIDMEESRHNRDVERRLKDAMRSDRARIQLGRISPFGLLEMSRQRLRPSLFESSTVACSTCGGIGFIRSTDSAAFHVLRALEEEGGKGTGGKLVVGVPATVALNLLNQRRRRLIEIEQRYDFEIEISQNDSLIPPEFDLKHIGEPGEPERRRSRASESVEDDDGRKRRRRRRRKDGEAAPDSEARGEARSEARGEARGESRGEARGESRGDEARKAAEEGEEEALEPQEEGLAAEAGEEDDEEQRRPRRRRGKRGGRRRSRRRKELAGDEEAGEGLQAEEGTGGAEEPGEQAEAPAEQGPEADSAEAAEPAAAEALEKPKARTRSRRRSSSRGKKAAEESEAPAEASEAAREAAGEAEEAEQEAKPARRRSGRGERSRQSKPRSGGRRGKAEPEQSEAEAPAAAAESAQPPAFTAPDAEPVAAAASPPEPDYVPSSGGPDAGGEAEDSDGKPKRRGWWSRFI